MGLKMKMATEEVMETKRSKLKKGVTATAQSLWKALEVRANGASTNSGANKLSAKLSATGRKVFGLCRARHKIMRGYMTGYMCLILRRRWACS
jgi:hypothetical protein